MEFLLCQRMKLSMAGMAALTPSQAVMVGWSGVTNMGCAAGALTARQT